MRNILEGIEEPLKKIEALKKTADFFNEELKTNADDIKLLLGLAFSYKDIYEIYGEILEDNEKNAYELMHYRKLAMNTFEKISIKDKTEAVSRFHLGFMYLNFGLYNKTKLIWQEFLKVSENNELFETVPNYKDMIEEVKQRISQLDAPIEIEKGENYFRKGNIFQAKEIFEKYIKDKTFDNYWPLYLNLSKIYFEENDLEKAEKVLFDGLKIKPLEQEMISLMIEIAKKKGDEQTVKKYERKLKL